jgi:hypothetical protein
VLHMASWLKEISWKKLFLFSLLFTIISFVVRQIESILTIKYYMMPEFFGVWSKVMMPKAGPPPISFMITSIIFAFATGISLGLIYYYLRNHLPKDSKRRVLYFADLMIAASFVFFTLPTYLMSNVPLGLLISWFISSFILIVIASWMLVKIAK